MSVLVATGFWLLTSLLSVASDLQVAVSPGLGGVARSEQWTFVRLDCVNNGDSFDGSVVVEAFSYNDTALPESHETLVSLPRGSKKAFFVYFPNDGQAAYWRVRLYAQHGRSRKVVHEERIGTVSGPQVASRFSPLASDSLFLPFVADENERSVRLEIPQPKTLSRTVQSVTVSAEELPDRWIGYDAADVVVAHASVFQRPMNDRLKALMDWVGAGGHLIVMARADEAGKFHADWAKVLGTQIATTMPLAPDKKFVERYGMPPVLSLRAVFEGVPQEALLADAQGPLLFRKQFGLGMISFSAIDLVGATWRSQLASTSMWRDLLANELAKSREAKLSRRANYGYDYHAQSIINGLRQIPALRPPSFAWLAAYLCLYLFVMVVLNYVVLRRLGRKEWSLFTFPAIAILFGIGAYWTGYLVRGGTSVLHRINLVELASGQTPGVARTFLGLFSAVREPCTLTFPREAYPQYYAINFQNPRDPYRDLPPMRVRETESTQATVPISVWTMRTFISDQSVRVADALRGQVTLSETNGVMHMDGWVENGLPATFTCRTMLVGLDAFNPVLEIPVNAKRQFQHERLNPTQGNFYLGGPSDQALSSVFQWWSGERRQPGFAYVVGSVPSGSLDSLAVRAGRAMSQEQTIIVLRAPVAVAAGQKTFGPRWWEPEIAQVESAQVSPVNWNQRASFYMNNGSVVLRYHLLGHQAGRRLKRLSINTNPQLWASSGQTLNISVFRRDENNWTNLTMGKAAEFDAAQVFDDVRGTVDIKLNTNRGGTQFQPEFVQLSGEAE